MRMNFHFKATKNLKNRTAAKAALLTLKWFMTVDLYSTLNNPSGSYFWWLRLQRHVISESCIPALLYAAKERGVVIWIDEFPLVCWHGFSLSTLCIVYRLKPELTPIVRTGTKTVHGTWSKRSSHRVWTTCLMNFPICQASPCRDRLEGKNSFARKKLDLAIGMGFEAHCTGCSENGHNGVINPHQPVSVRICGLFWAFSKFVWCISSLYNAMSSPFLSRCLLDWQWAKRVTRSFVKLHECKNLKIFLRITFPKPTFEEQLLTVQGDFYNFDLEPLFHEVLKNCVATRFFDQKEKMKVIRHCHCSEKATKASVLRLMLDRRMINWS